MKKYYVDEPYIFYAQIGLYMKKNEAEIFQQLVFDN